MFFKRKKKKTEKTPKKGKKRKLTREQKKIIKERQKRAAKRKSMFKGQPGFMADDGYIEYDGYVKIKNGPYIAVYDVLIDYGTHQYETIGWENMLIPSSPLRKGKIWFALREKGMSKAAEDDVMSHRLNSRKVTMMNQKQSSDVREDSKKQAELDDIQQTIELSKKDNVVDSDVLLIVKSNTPERLEDTVKELRQNYKDSGKFGISLVRKTSVQLDTLRNFPHYVSADAWHNSDLQTIDAARLFLPSSGFADSYGTYCGIDMHSYLAGTPSIIDFNGIRHAVICTGGVRGRVSVGGLEDAAPVSEFGSAWAHVVAEDNWLCRGTRTHHINLVPFNYHAGDSKVFDMSRYTINTLECYGTKETVEEDANNNFDKIVEIIMMLRDSDKPDPGMRGMVYKQLIDWIDYRAGRNGLYTSDPKHEPTLAYRILATREHDTYPTLQDFIPELQAMSAESAKKTEMAWDRANNIYNAVYTASKKFPTVFSDKTNIPDTFTAKDRNIYYDLSKIGGSPIIKGAIFLNVLAYVTNRAQSGDMIVVHGLDAVKVNPKIIKPYRDKMDKKGVGLITTFEERSNKEVNVQTMADFVHPLVEQDLVILGGLNKDNEEPIQNSWGEGRPLPATVKADLEANQESVFYVYRARDFGNAVINTHLVL